MYQKVIVASEVARGGLDLPGVSRSKVRRTGQGRCLWARRGRAMVRTGACRGVRC